MDSYRIHKILISIVIFVLVLILFRTIKSNSYEGKFYIKVGMIWILLIFIFNCVSIYFTLDYYGKNINKNGIRGPKGNKGSVGKKGSDMVCNQCKNSGQQISKVEGSNINDYGRIAKGPRVRQGTCIFPFIYKSEFIHGPQCVKTSPRDDDLNDAFIHGWCATSLNSDKTMKTYGYCNFSDKLKQQKENLKQLRSEHEKYLLNNNGILDIKIIEGNRSNIQCPNGFKKVSKDLNDGGGGKYIYLCKKEGLGSIGVSNVKLVLNNDTCGAGYRKLHYDLNKHSDSPDAPPTYLCLSKSNSNFIKDIIATNDLEPIQNYTNVDGINVNMGANNPVYIHYLDSKSQGQIIYLDTAYYNKKDKELYFFSNNKFATYDPVNKVIKDSYLITEKYQNIPNQIDAIFLSPEDDRIYILKDNLVYKINKKNDNLETGFPKKISNVFRGIPDNIDAVYVSSKNGKTYFIKNKFYYLYDFKNNSVDKKNSYPKNFNKRWINAPSNIHAMFDYKNKTYIIRNDKLRYVDKDDNVLETEFELKNVFPGISTLNATPTDDELICYADRYKKIKDEFGYDKEALRKHWLEYGSKEGKKFSCKKN